MTQYPNRTGLMVGVPLSGNPLVPEWAFSFHSLHPPMDYNVEYAVITGQPVDQARQTIAESAVAKKVKFLFFIDEDVTIPAHAIRQLIYHMEHFPKVAVAGAIYCHKSPPSMPMVFRGNGAGPYWDWKVGEVFDISGIGMGATLIRVDALVNLPKPWFKTIDSVERYMDGIPQGDLWTEDLYFCKLVKDAGFDIIADGGLLCDHWDAKTHTPYNLPAHSKPMRRTEVPVGTKRIVDLGSGPMKDSYNTQEGTVLRVDIREEVAPDYRCDLRCLPFGNKEFDIVFSSHVLEHFPRNEVGKVLDEWIRIMKDDGEFRLIVPNLAWAAQHILNKEIDNDVMNVLYGAQSYEHNYHKCGFIEQTIEQLLAERGFKKFVWDFNNYHMFVRAWKVPPAESIAPGEVAPISRVAADSFVRTDENPIVQLTDEGEEELEVQKEMDRVMSEVDHATVEMPPTLAELVQVEKGLVETMEEVKKES
jgi:predicted SAM-dependent methyltransferase